MCLATENEPKIWSEDLHNRHVRTVNCFQLSSVKDNDDNLTMAQLPTLNPPSVVLITSYCLRKNCFIGIISQETGALIKLVVRSGTKIQLDASCPQKVLSKRSITGSAIAWGQGRRHGKGFTFIYISNNVYNSNNVRLRKLTRPTLRLFITGPLLHKEWEQEQIWKEQCEVLDTSISRIRRCIHRFSNLFLSPVVAALFVFGLI